MADKSDSFVVDILIVSIDLIASESLPTVRSHRSTRFSEQFLIPSSYLSTINKSQPFLAFCHRSGACCQTNKPCRVVDAFQCVRDT